MPPARSPLALALCALVLAAPARAQRPFDPFELWDSGEERAAPRRRPPAAAKPWKQNATKIKKNDAQKEPAVNVDGFTRVFLTERPSSVNYLYPAYPGVNLDEISDNSLKSSKVVSDNKVLKPAKVGKATTAKPATTRRPPQRSTTSKPRTRRPSTTRRTSKPRPSTTRRPTTRASTSRPSTRKPARRKDPPPAPKPRPPSPLKDPACDEKVNSNWFSSWFGGNRIKTSFAPPGVFTGIYNLFSGVDRDPDEDEPDEPSENDGWFGSWFDRGSQAVTIPTLTTTTTTPRVPTTTTASSWFSTLLAQEDDDGAYAADQTNPLPRKKLRKTYKGYQLLRVFADEAWKVRELKDLQYETQDSGVTWWTTPALNLSGDMLVPPSLLSDIKDHLSSVGLEYDVVIWDLQKAIQYENPKLSKKQRAELVGARGHPLSWRRYHRYADHLRYLEYLALAFPRHVELLPLGRSAEGLPLVGAKVSQPGNWSQSKRWRLRSRMKPAVWVDGGLHAREWVAPAVASWILHALVEGEHGQGGDQNMLKMADWYILPVSNPDGYEHSHTHDRLWHKTRSRHSNEDFYYNSWFPWNWGRTDCIGADPNRNWDYHWGEKGSSQDPCHEHYAGPYAFSEPETRSISKFIMDHKERIKVYISLHAYSQMWLVPSSQSRFPYPDNAEVMEMGKLAVNALADMYGTKYTVGSMPDLIEPIGGASHDWARGKANVKYSYSVKMRDQHGPYGFLLPGSQIIATAKETWEAIKVIVDNL